MGINCQFNLSPPIEDIIDLYKSSGINRPIDDIDRIAQMYAHSNLVVSAWDEDKLVGIARSLSDFCYCCYLSNQAVRQEYKKLGIGKKLISLTKEKIGDQTMLLLLSATAAMDYYPKLNFEKVENGFIIKRIR
ncbi:MAG: GNAT family N-acetyltransferase [Bacteroidetes bacterium]|nr:GNAT family N-acetyltransferase [Bacteroidota bacterium]